MSKPNRTRRNTRAADQFKTKTYLRRTNTETPQEQAALDELIESRTLAFTKLFDRFERENVTETDAKQIARHATNDLYMSSVENQNLDNLEDLKVELLTAAEYQRVMTRAISALNTLLRNRVSYVEGVFYTNRQMKRAEAARHFRSLRVKQPTGWGAHVGKATTASEMVMLSKLRRQSRNTLYAQLHGV